MTEEDKKRLLSAILADDDLAQLRSEMLNRGLAEIRRRRRRNAMTRASLVVLPVAILAMVLSHAAQAPRETFHPSSKRIALATPVKQINAEQLLALFPHRAVALIGGPGHKQLVFLDEVPARSEPGSESDLQ